MRAALLFILIAGGYFGMEMVVAHKLRYRMEAIWILDQFADEAEAIERCGAPDPDRLARFHRNYDVVRRRAAKEIPDAARADSKPVPDAQAVEAQIATRISERTSAVAALVAQQGCEAAEVRTLLSRFRIHARLNAGGPAKDA